MTRSGALTPPLGANRKAHRTPGARPDPAAMKFLVFEDNSGGYHWAIVARSGETLVQSSSFASYEEAKQAARVVRAGAASAPFEALAGDIPPADLVAGRTRRTVRDDLDAERWLDEGGSFSSEAVTR
jgi:uncharacterized protein YegP (UPF0339 family)